MDIAAELNKANKAERRRAGKERKKEQGLVNI